MRAVRRLWITIGVWVSLVAPGAAARAVIVRAYNTYGLRPVEIEAASRSVQRLLAAVAIDARWRTCRIVDRDTDVHVDPCTDPMSPNEVIVRLVAGGAIAPDQSSAPLGYAYIDPVQKSGSL